MSLSSMIRRSALTAVLICLTGAIGAGVAVANDSKKKAARKDFDARGEVACAQERGQALGRCKAAVSRGTEGNATVVVRFANGFARKLYFEGEAFVSASATMSGVGRDTDWELKDGLHLIRVDDQQYEVPDALVFGD